MGRDRHRWQRAGRAARWMLTVAVSLGAGGILTGCPNRLSGTAITIVLRYSDLTGAISDIVSNLSGVSPAILTD